MASGSSRDDAVTELRGPQHPQEGSSDPQGITDPDTELVVFPFAERYVARTTLGEGGMGEVRLCRDRMIGREIAMKVIHPAVSSRTEIRARFVREARVQGQLEHPAIVPVHDFGVDPDGNAFFTMKRVRGITLEAVIEKLRRGDETTQREYPRHKLLAAFVRVCLAIDFAHERGVLHRDLKPENVMLGGYGEVYVLDWGLAKVRGASKSVDGRISDRAISTKQTAAAEKDFTDGDVTQRIDTGDQERGTAAGSVLGTPGYMAPEQIRGEDLDERTDVYSLGGILYELLTLEPLHGDGPVSRMMKRALQGVDARPSVRAPHRDVPPELEAVLVKACSSGRALRYPSARELADSVDAYLSGDRDLELRVELAQVHLGRAREAQSRMAVPGAGAEERETALREVGRAIALAPDDREALALLVQILTMPSGDPPKEVLESLERSARASERKMLPWMAIAYSASWLLFFPLQIAMGIRRLDLALVPLGLWCLTSALAWVAYKYDHTERHRFPYVTVSSGLALAATTLLHGPFFVVPAIAAVIAMAMSMVTFRRSRMVSTSICALAILVPCILAWADLHPVTYRFVDGALVVMPGALQLPREGTFVFLTMANVLVIVIAGLFTGEYRDQLSKLELASHMQAWQLRQLVPKEAQVPLPDAD